MREVILHFDNFRKTVLKDVFYLPHFKRNLIYIACLFNDDYSITFNKWIVIYKNRSLIYNGWMENNLYFIKPNNNLILQTEMVNNKLKTSHYKEGYLWHLRLGHINKEIITRLVKDGPLSMLKEVNLPQCESCLEGKMTKRSFNVKGTRASLLLELMHTNICGTISISVRGGYGYCVTFIDYSRYGYVYLMHHKSETLTNLKSFV